MTLNKFSGPLSALIAVEAQSRSGSVQAWDAAGRCCYHAPALPGLRAAVRLPETVVTALTTVTATGVAESSVTLAVLAGPGAFTGLRIAAFCVRSLAWDAEAQIIPVDHLAALAAGAAAMRPKYFSAHVPEDIELFSNIFVAVSFLKKDTTFVGVYRRSPQRWQAVVAAQAVHDDEALPPELASACAVTDFATGLACREKADVIQRWWNEAGGVTNKRLLAPSAVTSAGVALAAVGHQSVPWHQFLPVYGQASAAELQRQQLQQQKQNRAERASVSWRNRVEISLDAIAANISWVQDFAGDRKVVAVVKADAYGLGLERVAPVLWQQGVRIFAIAALSEAERLRSILPRAIMLSSPLPFERAAYHDLQVEICCSDIEEIAALATLGLNSNRPVAVHVAIDTGMGRTGSLPADLPEVLAEIVRSVDGGGLSVRGILSHYASALHDDAAGQQEVVFRTAVQAVDQELDLTPIVWCT